MLTFLLWNINRQQPILQLARLVAAHDVDVVLLIESGFQNAGDVLLALNATAQPQFRLLSSKVKAVTMFAKFSSQFTSCEFEKGRLIIRRFFLPGREDFLLAAVHFPSKLWMNNRSQAVECGKLADKIRQVEEDIGHSKTLLVGDLNMNPFESGMIAAGSLNAVMTRAVAERGIRRVQRADYRFFYNPMWSLLGDGNRGPAGTYYRDSADHHDYFWNMFDQVLVRPQLLPSFQNEHLHIISEDGVESFLEAAGIPNADGISDHLPIVFKLNI